MLQGKNSNYDTDIFQPTIKEIERLSGKKYGFTTPSGENGEATTEQEKIDIAMRVIADHMRAVVFLCRTVSCLAMQKQATLSVVSYVVQCATPIHS